MTTASAPTTNPAPAECAAAPPAPLLVHGGGSVERYYAQHFQGAVFPLSAGLLLYGWRALIVTAIVVGTAAATTFVWQRVGRRGRDISMSHATWLALLLALALPPHLASLAGAHSARAAFWLLPAAGMLIVIVLWVLR